MGLTNTSSDLLPGTLELLVLKALARGAKHGYAIVEHLRATSGDVLQIGQPFLAELRSMSGESDFCKHMEGVVLGIPDAEAILTRRRETMRAAAKVRGSTPVASGIHEQAVGIR
jgi:hypothetical protein